MPIARRISAPSILSIVRSKKARALSGPLIRSLLILPTLTASGAALAGNWYRGDLHLHSTHSDGDGTVADIVGRAELQKLDFIAITDHDSSTGGKTPTWDDPALQSDSVVMLYGMEWTTGRGHANIWNDTTYDYAPLWTANRNQDFTMGVTAAHDAGAVISVNHPTDYDCCPWQYGMLERADAIEVWNGTFRLPAFNHGAVENVWDSLLLSGSSPTAVGGSDTHYWQADYSDYKTAGNPTTWVFADSKAPDALLTALVAGRVSISYAPDAARLELKADEDGDGVFEARMGDQLVAQRPVRFQASTVLPDGGGTSCKGSSAQAKSRGIRKLSPAAIRDSFRQELPPSVAAKALIQGPAAANQRILVVIRNGEVVDTVALGCDNATYVFEDVPPPGSYYRLELVGGSGMNRAHQFAYGFTLAVSNPIFAW